MKAETVLFAAPDDETGVEGAREYIRKNSLTADDVRLSRMSDGMVCVIAKKEVTLDAERNECMEKPATEGV